MKKASSNDSDLPAHGWEWLGVKDLLLEGSPGEKHYTRCEYCSKERVRFLHELKHVEANRYLRVGVNCAHKLCDDPNIDLMETQLRAHAQKRMNFPKLKGWQKSAKGNEWIEYEDHHVIVMKWGRGFRLRIDGDLGKMTFSDASTAKLRAFDVVARKLKRETWPSPRN